MDRFPGLRRAFRLGVPNRELDDELAFHFEHTVEDLMRKGMSSQTAREEAHRRFGDERAYRRELERIDRGAAARLRWAERWETGMESIRYALRRMRRSPGFTAAVVLTFALGIGVNATMFGILDRLLLSPPAHIEDADEVKRLMVESYYDYMGSREMQDYLTYPDFRDFSRASSFTEVAGYATRTLTVGRGAEARQLEATTVTGNMFSLLGVRPAIGRFFTQQEDRIGGPNLVVISHALWQGQFGGRRDVIGKTLDFGYGPYTIVGVTPPGFTGVDLEKVDLWLPLHSTRAAMMGTGWLDSRNWSWIRVVARLAPGVEERTAEAEATTLHRRGWAEQIEADEYDPRAEVLATSLILARGPTASGESAVAKWLAGISLVVLLIACANVANLLLARAVRQRREVGIRLALGSSRARILGQVLTESVLLSLLGGVAALLMSRWGGDFVRAVLLPDVAWENTGLQPRVTAVVIGLALLAGTFAGLIPALQASRPRLTETLKSASRSATGASSRTRSVLTILQAALSVVLLVGAGLFVKSLNVVRNLDMGFDPDGVLMFTPVLDRDFPDERIASLARLATERLDNLPGVVAASPDISVPFWSIEARGLRVPGLDSFPVLPSGNAALHAVEPDYFEVMDLRILRGRGLMPADMGGAPPVAVVDETMARVVWPGQEAIGKCFYFQREESERDPPCITVVGVVENSRRFELVEQETMNYYLPVDQAVLDLTPSAILIRVRGSEEAMIPVLQREMLDLDPALRFAEVQPLSDLIDPRARSWKLGATMFSAFGILALLVAAIGLYSVLAFSVAQRTFELGIRSALGATRERMIALILGQSLRLAGLGIALGLLIALVAGPKVEPLLFDVSPSDPVILTGVAAVLALVAVLAGCLPAWRATRVDPSVALRAE